jgi:hypothetical protein
MTHTSTPVESDHLLQKNVTALRTVDAELADRLAAIALPADIVPTVGRDGSSTFKRRTPEGERWLGHTSMPTVSGPALLGNFDPGEGNVVLVGIGQGVEARLLAEHLRPNQAVFVLERDPVQLALALRVHDLALPLEQGRLVMIVAEDLGDGLVRFLSDHEGYLPPERMLAWPWLDSAATDDAKSIVQGSASEATRRRTAALTSMTDHLHKTHAHHRTLPERPRTMVVCPHAQPEACRRTADVMTGLSALDWPAASWLGDTPRTGHPLTLARRINEVEPDMVILMDAVRGGVAKVLPPTIPVASWLTSLARFEPPVVEGIGPEDGVFAMTDRVRANLVEAGFDPSRVHWLGPCVVTMPSDTTMRDRPIEHDVVAIADAPSLDPATYGLRLESHQSAWNGARGLIAEQAEGYTSEDVERTLRRAESATGVSFADESLRQEFCDHVNAVLGQALVRQAVFEAVLRAGVKLSIFGRGWQDHPTLAAAWKGAVSPEDRPAVYASARIVLQVDVTGNVTTELLRAAASGAVVVARAHPSDQGPAGLAQLLRPDEELLSFKQHSELINHLKRLLSDPSAAGAIASRAREKVADQHTITHRLTDMRTAMAQAAIE